MFKLARDAMRTRFEVVIADDGNPSDLRAAAEAALDEVERVELQLSAYNPDAQLFRINQQAANGPVKIDPRLFVFLQRATELSKKTGGAFDMTVGPLMRLWKLAGGAGDGAQAPSDAEIAEVLACVGMARVLEFDVDEQTARFAREGVWLDPGAIGKGYALERAAQLLREDGIRDALIHGGTSTAVGIGKQPGQEGWRIAIQHPLEKGRRLGEVVLKDAALSVSAVHGKTVSLDGERVGHLIDPRNGQPVEKNILSALVMKSATEADALSTAVLVAGETSEFLKLWPDASALVAALESDGVHSYVLQGSDIKTY